MPELIKVSGACACRASPAAVATIPIDDQLLGTLETRLLRVVAHPHQADLLQQQQPMASETLVLVAEVLTQPLPL